MLKHRFLLLLVLLLQAADAGQTSNLLPIGADCRSDEDCASDRCYQAWNGDTTCQCNAQTNVGCDGGVFIICSNLPTYVDGLPECVDPSTLGQLLDACADDEDCFTKNCYASVSISDTYRTCRCNTETNVGCENERPRCYDNSTVEDEAPICVDLFTGLLPLGSDCLLSEECSSGYCFFFSELQGTNAPGVCSCRLDTNAGCVEERLCYDDPLIEDEAPTCIDPTLLAPIGDECFYDRECQSFRCYYGEQLPGTPGTCSCNSDTNAGCKEGFICSDEPTYSDGLPECVQSEREIGDKCISDDDCNSNRCYYGLQPPDLPGTCA